MDGVNRERLVIRGDLNRHTAEGIRAELLGKIVGTAGLDLEVEELGDLDIVGVQLLLSTRKTVEMKGREFRLIKNDSKERINRFLRYAGIPVFA